GIYSFGQSRAFPFSLLEAFLERLLLLFQVCFLQLCLMLRGSKILLRLRKLRADFLPLLHQVDFFILNLLDLPFESMNLLADCLELLVFSRLKLLGLILADSVPPRLRIELESFLLNLEIPKTLPDLVKGAAF